MNAHPSSPSVNDRAALESTLRFMDKRIKPLRCDSDGVSDCWRCQSMYLAKRMRELLAEMGATTSGTEAK